MKRDMDLIRLVMIEIEKNPDPIQPIAIKVPGYSDLEISYHVMLLAEHGFAEAINFSSNDGFEWQAQRLTFEGHEFLDAARSDTIWKTAKEKIVSATGVVTLESLKFALPLVLKHMLSGHLGL
jgi:hypothetical protein